MNEAREKIKEVLDWWYGKRTLKQAFSGRHTKIALQILNLEGENWRIAIVEKEGELPNKPPNWKKEGMNYHAGYYACQKDYNGFRKVIKE